MWAPRVQELITEISYVVVRMGDLSNKGGQPFAIEAADARAKHWRHRPRHLGVLLVSVNEG